MPSCDLMMKETAIARRVLVEARQLRRIKFSCKFIHDHTDLI